MRKARRDGWPCKFIVVSRDENKHIAARQAYPDARYVVCDVLDQQRLNLIMQGVATVIHAAAAKHIPVCEYQPSEALRVNIDGTRCVIDAAYAAGVDSLVLISTDKACEPVNTYGATKMLVERLVFESRDFEHFSTAIMGCRYGNIIGSTGSIWPVFKAQRERDGYLSVTDPTMTRYFWSIEEAVDLITYSLNGPRATVLLPTLRAIVMHDLAEYLTLKWGLPSYKIIGSRPGEKKHEMLLSPNERARTRVLGNGRWALYGPTVKINPEYPTIASGDVFTSDTASPLSPEEFVSIAEDSETV